MKLNEILIELLSVLSQRSGAFRSSGASKRLLGAPSAARCSRGALAGARGPTKLRGQSTWETSEPFPLLNSAQRSARRLHLARSWPSLQGICSSLGGLLSERSSLQALTEGRHGKATPAAPHFTSETLD